MIRSRSEEGPRGPVHLHSRLLLFPLLSFQERTPVFAEVEAGNVEQGRSLFAYIMSIFIWAPLASFASPPSTFCVSPSPHGWTITQVWVCECVCAALFSVPSRPQSTLVRSSALWLYGRMALVDPIEMTMATTTKNSWAVSEARFVLRVKPLVASRCTEMHKHSQHL